MPCGAPAGAVLRKVGVVGLQVDAVLGDVADPALKVAAVTAQVIQRRPAVAVYQLRSTKKPLQSDAIRDAHSSHHRACSSHSCVIALSYLNLS